MKVAIKELRSGTELTLYVLFIDKSCPVLDFITHLSQREEEKLFALIDHIADNGLPNNVSKFKPVGDSIYQLKTPDGVRILCFYGGPGLRNSLILSNGFFKPKKKIFAREKQSAIESRKQYFETDDNKKKSKA